MTGESCAPGWTSRTPQESPVGAVESGCEADRAERERAAGCSLARYHPAPGDRGLTAPGAGRRRGIPYTRPRFPARRYLAQLPQGRKAARVSELFRVRGEPLSVWERTMTDPQAEIIAELNVPAEFNAYAEIERRITFLTDLLGSTGAEGYV